MRLENSFLFVPGIGERTEQKLWQEGVRRWEDFPGNTVLGATMQERGKTFLEKAQKNLAAGNSHFFHHHLPGRSVWRLYEDFKEEAMFFDIETTGLDQRRNTVTMVSAHHAGDTMTLVKGKNLARETLETLLSKAEVLVSFNGKRFDVPFLQHRFDIDIDTPHIDLLYLSRRLGLTGGLKALEQTLGMERELEDIDGREAIRLWKRYQRGDDTALETLIQYNRLDAENLKQVLEELHQRLRADVFEPHIS